jgi:cyclopropane fatty-acyl-phospholipid synthase-like methyltransferase
MHGDNLESIGVWERNTAENDERRFEMLKTLLPNQRALDLGCGNGGFLKKAQELASGGDGD